MPIRTTAKSSFHINLPGKARPASEKNLIEIDNSHKIKQLDSESKTAHSRPNSIPSSINSVEIISPAHESTATRLRADPTSATEVEEVELREDPPLSPKQEKLERTDPSNENIDEFNSDDSEDENDQRDGCILS